MRKKTANAMGFMPLTFHSGGIVGMSAAPRRAGYPMRRSPSWPAALVFLLVILSGQVRGRAESGAATPAGDRGSGHWAFREPRRPTIPVAGPASNGMNPVDAFVRARLSERGLVPAVEAGRSTLLRRVTLDLTGLPPTPDEVASFETDLRPGAFERVVDRLLASPRFGERMAQDWLDAARYADSNGYQVDRDRDMWAWRDWVIRTHEPARPRTKPSG